VKVQDWIFSVRYIRYVSPGDHRPHDRHAVVGPARSSTVEAALHLGEVPEHVRAQIRGCDAVRDFVEGRLDPNRSGYYTSGGYSGEQDDDGSDSWAVCIGSVHEVLDR